MICSDGALKLVAKTCKQSVGLILTVAVLSAGLVSAKATPERPKILGLSHLSIHEGVRTRDRDVKIGKNRKRLANLFDPDGTRTEVPSTALPPH